MDCCIIGTSSRSDYFRPGTRKLWLPGQIRPTSVINQSTHEYSKRMLIQRATSLEKVYIIVGQLKQCWPLLGIGTYGVISMALILESLESPTLDKWEQLTGFLKKLPNAWNNKPLAVRNSPL